MTELEKAARMALEALQKAVPKDAKQAREQLDAITALTQALATTELTKAELIAQARDLIEAQEHAHEVGYRMGFAAATERKGEPVAWMWQHEETGRKGFVEADQLAMGWEVANPRLKIVAPLYTSPQVPEDTALLDFMEERRVSLIPEYEGPWAARQYDDDPQFAADAEGATPRDALRALFDAARKGEKS